MSQVIDITATLQARAKELAAAAGRDAQQRGQEHLIFRLGTARLAVDLAAVRTVLPPHRPTRMPSAPPFLAGIIHFQGNIVAVADLRRVLALSDAASEHAAAVILLEHRGRMLGLAAEIANDIERIDLEQLASFSRRDGQAADSLVRGVTPDITLVLDVTRTFAELSIGATPNQRSAS